MRILLAVTIGMLFAGIIIASAALEEPQQVPTREMLLQRVEDLEQQNLVLRTINEHLMESATGTIVIECRNENGDLK